MPIPFSQIPLQTLALRSGQFFHSCIISISVPRSETRHLPSRPEQRRLPLRSGGTAATN